MVINTHYHAKRYVYNNSVSDYKVYKEING